MNLLHHWEARDTNNTPAFRPSGNNEMPDPDLSPTRRQRTFDNDASWGRSSQRAHNETNSRPTRDCKIAIAGLSFELQVRASKEGPLKQIGGCWEKFEVRGDYECLGTLNDLRLALLFARKRSDFQTQLTFCGDPEWNQPGPGE